LEDPKRVLKIPHWSRTVAAHYTPHYIDAKRETNWKFGPSWEKPIIVGILSRATYRIRREVGNKKVKTVNKQKLKPRHCGDRDGPPEQDKEEPGRDTKGRRIQEESKEEDEDMSKDDKNQNTTPDETQVHNKAEEDR
jgi:hypothetical protein